VVYVRSGWSAAFAHLVPMTFPKLQRLRATVPVKQLADNLHLGSHPVLVRSALALELELYEPLADQPRRQRKKANRVRETTLQQVAACFPKLVALQVTPSTHGALLDLAPDKGNPFMSNTDGEEDQEEEGEAVGLRREISFAHFSFLTALNLHGQPVDGNVFRALLSTIPLLRSAVLSHNKMIEHIERKARAGYTFLDDITGNVSRHLEELDVHRCPRLSDTSLSMLLEPALTPNLKRISIDGCVALVSPNTTHVGRLEGIWINYSEHGMPVSNLAQPARDAIAPRRHKVKSDYGDLVSGSSACHGIRLQ